MDETKNFGRCHNWRQQAPILPKDPIQNSLVESNQNLNLWFLGFSVKLTQMKDFWWQGNLMIINFSISNFEFDLTYGIQQSIPKILISDFII